MDKEKQLIKDMFAEATESMKSQILSAILNEDAASNVLRYNSLLPIRDSAEINYAFLLKRFNDITFVTTTKIIRALLETKGITASEIDTKEQFSDDPHSFLVVRESSNQYVLYVFKSFGKVSPFIRWSVRRVANALLSSKQFDLLGLKYICMSETEPYLAIFDHNDNSEDPSRGTNMYSLNWFFEKYLTADLYQIFVDELLAYTKEIKKYLGMRVVNDLIPQSLYVFKKILSDNIKNFDYWANIQELNVPESQYIEIRKRFLDSRYRVLLSDNDFAKSFVTAEWLYSSLGKDNQIDLTPIAMGYLKSVEQFLYAFIRMVAKDNTNRTIQFSKEKIYKLTPKLVEEKRNDITLGILTGFVRFERNSELLLEEFRNEAYQGFRELLWRIKSLRNGYFHKDNLYIENDGAEIVEAIRNNAYLMYFFMLGMYKFDEEQMTMLMPHQQNSYTKLREYVCCHNHSAYYISFAGEELQSYLPATIKVDFDNNGEPILGDLVLRHLSELPAKEMFYQLADFQLGKDWKGEATIISEEKLKAAEVYIGDIEPVAEGARFSGPDKLIFKDGVFIEN